MRIYFSLLKGFVCTGILYMPKNFKNSGWLWGVIAMFVSFLLTQICADKLLQARKRFPRASFTDLGKLSMGRPGQYMVDIFLSIAQIGFLIGQTYFIASNLQQVMHDAFGVDLELKYYGLTCFIITTPLSYVREIERFAFSYVLADVLILVTTVAILVYSTMKLVKDGPGEEIELINT